MCKACESGKDVCTCGHERWYHVAAAWAKDGECMLVGCSCEKFVLSDAEESSNHV